MAVSVLVVRKMLSTEFTAFEACARTPIDVVNVPALADRKDITSATAFMLSPCAPSVLMWSSSAADRK